MKALATVAQSSTPAALRQVSALAQNAVNAVHQEYKYTFENHCCHITRLRPDILVVDFPDKERRHWLATQLNREFGGEYLVLNLSGDSYDTSEFQGPVMDILTMSRTVLPLEVLMRLCVSAHRWLLSAKSENITQQRALVVHGATGNAPGPLLVLLSCYLSWAGAATASDDDPSPHPKETLIEICAALGIPESSASPSQRRYLSYFELLQHDLAADVATLVLSRIALVGIGGDGCQRILQVWQQDTKLFQATVDSCDIAGAAVLVGLQCRGDMSVQVLLVLPACEGRESSEELEMLVCFHTAFIGDGFARFPEPEIDVFRNGADNGRTIDIFFEPVVADVKDMREAAAVATAAAAVASGPRDTMEAAPVQSEEPPAAARESWSAPMAFNLAAQDTSPVKTVFVADDIDRFFSDL